MKAIKIDAENRVIEMVDLSNDPDKRLKEMQEIVGGYIALGIDWEEDTLYVDDAGLLKNPEFFQFWPFTDRGPRLFAGSGVVIGTDYSTGESKDISFTIEQVEQVQFVDSRMALILAEKYGL